VSEAGAVGGFTNVAEYLTLRAREQPDALAVVRPTARVGGRRQYERTTFAELEDTTRSIAEGLGQIGVGRGTRTVVMVRPSPTFFALTFALFRLGAVPVMVDPGMGLRGLAACLGRARPEAFIGVPEAHAARAALGWARDTVRTRVMVGARALALAFGRGMHTLDEVTRRGRGARAAIAPVGRDDLAAVLFTSGSTGLAKGAVYRHGNFLAQVESIRAMYGIAPGEVDLPTFPLFALFDPALGMTTVLPDMDFARPARVDGARVAEAIADWGVTNMFGSPAVLDAVARWGDGRGVRFHTLRRVLSAGAPVHPRILERFRRLLPDDARIHTPYGATEALPVATIDDATILGETRRATDAGEGVCVGRPVPGAEVEIIRLDDAPIARWSDALRLPPGAVGEITVRGEQVTRDYFDDAANTAAHKILHDDGGVRHRVGDVGYLDPDGRLWFCGRKSHRVAWEGRTLFTEQVEGPFNALAAVRRSALVKGVGGRLFLFVEPVDARSARRPERLASELRAVASGLGLTLTFALRAKLPVDARHNAKILREVLAREVARRAPAGALP
jgi:acyl-CoA synthetase (AMP-forming)/AMP-acid ligase II